MKKIIFLASLLIVSVMLGQDALNSKITERFDGTDWVNDYKTEFTYDSSNNLEIETEYYWDSYLSQWVKSSTQTITYNSNNKATIEFFQGFNMGVVIDQDRSLYTYNSDGNIIKIVEEEYSNSNWEVTEKVDLIYINGKLTSANIIDGDGTQPDDEYAKIVLTYNTNGTIQNYYFLSLENGVWEDDERYLLTYDSNDRLILEEAQDNDEGVWANLFKRQFTYDSNGNIIKKITQEFDEGSWGSESIETFTYDTTQNISSFIHPFVDYTGVEYLFEPLGIINKIVSSTEDEEGSMYRSTYYYGDATASLANAELEGVIVYPNPTAGVVFITNNFTLDKVDVFNFLGQKVLSTNQNKIDIHNFSNGIYLFRVYAKDGKSSVKKVIKH